MTEEAYKAGKELGEAAGSWIIDGNTSDETARYLLKGITDGDPAVLDQHGPRSPLSGEWAGESIPELSDQYGIDLTDDDEATRFEEGYDTGYWDTVERDARAIAASESLFIAARHTERLSDD